MISENPRDGELKGEIVGNSIIQVESNLLIDRFKFFVLTKNLFFLIQVDGSDSLIWARLWSVTIGEVSPEGPFGLKARLIANGQKAGG